MVPAASVDNYAGEDNKENIFSIKYTYTSDYNGNTDGNHWMVMFGMREFTSYPYGNGWGITVNGKLWDSYKETDTRRSASIISVDDEEIPFDKINNQREYTGYYNKKYSPMSDIDGNSVVTAVGGVSFQISQFQDYVVMRYSDVLLMAAELGSANAQTYFDEVRQRAYKENFVSTTVSQENIMKERHLEFALEGVRYWDLLRQGVNTAASTIAETTELLSGGVSDTKTISEENIKTTNGLIQIPNTQITLSNNVLQQNAGW
ncbi:RagB/SusD family nutrient uptake outer membrane protein [Thalassobellus suaedae]|uniref:RagB/SusD family nutrient uptake outer membrane protein n=1 Tax=Thalassobellus suaedae TaxID=3074124 RepID=A0ABY9XUC7_9FLAO|nr:RagB/SusD family nutrient uptake outer membrane protein [Flavobacteriaceae bacterium HL-DH14]